MVSTYPLYSHQGKEPAKIPEKIRFPDGSSRSDSSSYTKEEIELAGYTGPYFYPQIDITKEQALWDSEKLEFIVKDLPNPALDYTEDQLWKNIRDSRDFLLSITDWCVTGDSPFSDAEKNEIIEYRQLLRDWPSTITDLRNPGELPTKPDCIKDTDNPTYHLRNIL